MDVYWAEDENGAIVSRQTGLDCYWRTLTQSEMCERCGQIVPTGARGYYFAYMPYALPSQYVCWDCLPDYRQQEAREA